MKTKKLYIIAAGLSSRMGGYPKHLCVIDNEGTTNLEHTLSLATKYYDEIIVVINKVLPVEYILQTMQIINKYNAIVKFIESGKGDGHAVYEGIKTEIDVECVTCIWGDTYFSDSIFKTIVDSKLDTNLLKVVCTKEISPYCYILENNDKIDGIYFKSEKPINENDKYLHDQSMFIINVDEYIKYFSQYMKYCDYITQSIVKTKGLEYSIIKFINWCRDIANINISTFVLPEKLDDKYTISFNTQEELNEVKRIKRS